MREPARRNRRIEERPDRTLARELAGFRSTHQKKHLYSGLARWDYLVGGRGERTLLLLGAGTAVAESWFKQFSDFEQDYRIIAPDYPAETTIHALVDGLLKILAEEKTAAVTILGASFGGMLAQCLVREHPENVSKLILANTTFPNRLYALRLRRNLLFMKLTPWVLMRGASRARAVRLLNAPIEERRFWEAFYREKFGEQIDKRQLVAIEQCMIDYSSHYRFAPGELSEWAGSILIIESDTDPFFKGRVNLKALYPRAKVHTFFGAGPMPSVSRREQFNAVVRSFLARNQG